MSMFIHFFCLCPLSLAIKLNFNISKVVYFSGMTLIYKLFFGLGSISFVQNYELGRENVALGL